MDDQSLEIRCRFKEPRGDYSSAALESNEAHPESFFPFLEEAAPGIYLGVGTTQNYHFIPKMKATSAIICDLAENVMAAHHYWKVLFTNANNEKEFRQLAARPPSDLPLDCLNENERKWYEKAAYWGVGNIVRKELLGGRKLIPYSREAHLLHQEGKIELIHANLFYPKTLRQLGSLVRAREERITAIYFSNIWNGSYGHAISQSKKVTPQKLVEIFSDESVFDQRAIVLYTTEDEEKYAYPDQALPWHYSCFSLKQFGEALSRSTWPIDLGSLREMPKGPVSKHF